MIGVLRRGLAKGVVRSWSGEARRCVVVTAFSTRAVVAYLPTLAPIGVANEFRSLCSRFCQLGRALICFSSESNDR